jgi:hypothetical protein
MKSKRMTALALAVAGAAALVTTAPAAHAGVLLPRLVTLHGTMHGALRWKLTNPDVGRASTLGAQGTVGPLGPGTSFIGTEHFPGFVARGYVQGQGKLSGLRGAITFTFRFGPYKGFTSTIITRGRYSITSGTGQFTGATGTGVIAELIGGPIGTGPNPRPLRLTIAFNPPPIVKPILP